MTIYTTFAETTLLIPVVEKKIINRETKKKIELFVFPFNFFNLTT